jgi:hypothetical protein
VVREAYNRDYAKVLEAMGNHVKEIPQLAGLSGENAIGYLAATILELEDRLVSTDKVERYAGSYALALKAIERFQERIPHIYSLTAEGAINYLASNLLENTEQLTVLSLLVNEVKHALNIVSKRDAQSQHRAVLAAIDALKTAKANINLPKRERGDGRMGGTQMYVNAGWNNCLDEILKLNPQLDVQNGNAS